MADVLSSIPFYGGFRAREQQIQGDELEALKMAGAGMQLQDSLQKQRERQVLREAAMESGGDPKKYIEALAARGVYNPAVLKEVREGESAAATTAWRRAQTQNLLNPQQKPAPIGAGGLRLPDGSIVPPQARPESDRPQPIGSGGLRLPDGTVVPPAARPGGGNPSDLGRLIAERDALPQGDPRRTLYDRRIDVATTRADRPEQPLMPIQDSNSPTGYRYGTRGEARNQPAPGPFERNLGVHERQVSEAFERNPVVKGYMDLQPDVDVVNNYMARRPNVPVSQRAVYDKNLINTFMRVTHPKGDQISNFERKDMGALPTLPDRITRAVEGFFSGSFVPDDVAAEMANIIREKFSARERQVMDLEGKAVADVTRRGGTADAIRKITRGRVLPAPEDPKERKANTVYQTPRGPMTWTGTGWLPN